MGENKGHSDKAPNYPELDEMGSAASRAGQNAGNRQSAGGQRQNQQKGGQHASGGTPALDDLNADLDSRNRGSLGNASQQMDQTSGWDGKQDKNR